MRNTRKFLFAAALAAVAVPALADSKDAGVTMRFNSIPVAEKVGAGEHRIFPYRNEDKVVVIVIDPISCGQKPVNPRFEIKDTRLILAYDLVPAKGANLPASCTAHSTFELDAVPHRDFSVEFTGGPEPVRVAHMTRCPKTDPVIDIWDCLVPLK
jgi:hypothetical protein